MPDDPALAEPESLKDQSLWAEARRLAGTALDKLGEEKRPPRLLRLPVEALPSG